MIQHLKIGRSAQETVNQQNKVKDIGVKCANCVLYQGGNVCRIIAMPVEPEGKCRFAVLPDGVVQGDK